LPDRRYSSERSRAVLAVGHAGNVLLIETAGGRILWEVSLAELPAGAPCEGQPVKVEFVDDCVIAACMGQVFALSIEDGAVLWQVNRRGRGDASTNIAVKQG
jgi:outer membrane protein assembly factor BamB